MNLIDDSVCEIENKSAKEFLNTSGNASDLERLDYIIKNAGTVSSEVDVALNGLCKVIDKISSFIDDDLLIPNAHDEQTNENQDDVKDIGLQEHFNKLDRNVKLIEAQKSNSKALLDETTKSIKDSDNSQKLPSVAQVDEAQQYDLEPANASTINEDKQHIQAQNDQAMNPSQKNNIEDLIVEENQQKENKSGKKHKRKSKGKKHDDNNTKASATEMKQDIKSQAKEQQEVNDDLDITEKFIQKSEKKSRERPKYRIRRLKNTDNPGLELM